MSVSTISFELGRAVELYDIFSFSPKLAADKSPSSLRDSIEHSINQTILRDGFFSAWAVVSNESRRVWKDDDVYSVRISSPQHDVSAYEVAFPKFLAAIAAGRKIYEAQLPVLAARRKKLVEEWNKLYPDGHYTEADFDCFFLPPFGLWF